MTDHHFKARGRSLRAEAHQLEAKGLQQIECAVAGLQAEVLYNLLIMAVAQPELPVSVGPPLSKRKQIATAIISSLTAQESEAITTKPKESVSLSRGGSHLSIPQSKEEAIPAEMEALRINVGDTKWVYHCHVEGCTEGPSTS